MAYHDGKDMLSLKRPFYMPDEVENPAPKRQKQAYHHHHYLHYKQTLHSGPDEHISSIETAEPLLVRAIAIACKEAGFDAVSPAALEGFRGEVEGYVLRFLSCVSISMLSSRRTLPIPQDFLFALSQHKLSTSSLHPYLHSTIAPSVLLPPLPSPPPPPPPTPNLIPVLGPELSGAAEVKRRPYIPAHLPVFPSKHTYRATMPVLANRHDPRKLRERAIEEGRSGEEALRKLMRACNPAASRVGRLSTKKSLKRIESEAQWAKTFAAISERNLGLFTSSRAMELDVERTSEVQEGLSPSQLEPPDNRPTVNCDRAYWRKGKAEKGMNPKKGAPSIKSRTTVNSMDLA